MMQSRLNSLLILATENDLREGLDLNKLVDEFATNAPRRMVLY